MWIFHQELTCDFWRVTIQNNISISSFEQNIFQNQQNHAQPISRHVDKKKIEIYLPWYFCLTANSKVENAGFLMKFLCQNGNGADQYTRWQKSRLRLQVNVSRHEETLLMRHLEILVHGQTCILRIFWEDKKWFWNLFSSNKEIDMLFCIVTLQK